MENSVRAPNSRSTGQKSRRTSLLPERAGWEGSSRRSPQYRSIAFKRHTRGTPATPYNSAGSYTITVEASQEAVNLVQGRGQFRNAEMGLALRRADAGRLVEKEKGVSSRTKSRAFSFPSRPQPRNAMRDLLFAGMPAEFGGSTLRQPGF